MPEFACRLGTPSGDILEETIIAEDETALRHDCERKDLFVISVRRKSGLARLLRNLSPLRPKVSTKEFLLFNQELSALIRAGLPIIASLDILLERRKNHAFRAALEDIRDRVKAGEALSEAFNAQGLFPKIYSSTLASGERSGEIATVLRRYIAYVKTLLGLRRKVTSALIYPIILMCLSMVLICILIYFVIPNFAKFYTDFGAKDLPLITQILVTFATFVRGNIIVIIAVVIGAAASFSLWRQTEAGSMALDRLKLRLPLLGRVWNSYAISRFSRTLSTLVSGGIPLVTSLEITSGAIGNLVFTRNVQTVAQKVKEGQPLWDSLEKTGLFSNISVEMIKVGESTGALEEMLNSISDFLDEEIDAQLTNIVSLIEPLVLIVMAVLVGGILLAIYYPLLQAYGGQKFSF
ncbi:MAG: type II secretion system F family protein [Acidobacteria bacterium]|nr:MAG: type II secretion system F family protein [Acidobacteriota bacterium]